MKVFQRGQEFFRVDGQIGSLLEKIDEFLLDVIRFDENETAALEFTHLSLHLFVRASEKIPAIRIHLVNEILCALELNETTAEIVFNLLRTETLIDATIGQERCRPI